MNPSDLWAFLPWGYLLTVAIELPLLLLGLSARHAARDRMTAGLWLTACTYPIVVLVLPLLIENYTAYLVVAEIFAPLTECLLFYAVYVTGQARDTRATWCDMLVVAFANLASFALGMLLWSSGLVG